VNNNKAQVLPYGSWTIFKGLDVNPTQMWHRRKDMQGHFFKISALVNQPYVTKADGGCTDSKCFQGMYPDVWQTLLNIMNFTYLLIPPPERSWGTLKDGKWNGMVGNYRFL
jgi:hypothetical protein